MLVLEQVKVLRSCRTPAVAARRAILPADAFRQVSLVDAQSSSHFSGRTPKSQWRPALLFSTFPHTPSQQSRTQSSKDKERGMAIRTMHTIHTGY